MSASSLDLKNIYIYIIIIVIKIIKIIIIIIIIIITRYPFTLIVKEITLKYR